MIDSPGRADITRLLLDWRGGDQAALGQLIPLVLDRIACATDSMTHSRLLLEVPHLGTLASSYTPPLLAGGTIPFSRKYTAICP